MADKAVGEGWGQGSGQATTGGEWQNGLCDCCGNCRNCMCGTFCGHCLVYENADRMGKSGCLYCLLSCIFPCIPLMLLRSDMRDKHALDGSTTKDACASLWCTSCVNCQVANELDTRGVNTN